VRIEKLCGGCIHHAYEQELNDLRCDGYCPCREG